MTTVHQFADGLPPADDRSTLRRPPHMLMTFTPHMTTPAALVETPAGVVIVLKHGPAPDDDLRVIDVPVELLLAAYLHGKTRTITV